MKTSIALATYNGESYVQEQLDSYLAQTQLPDELIVSDDCSSDNTQKILVAFAKKALFRVVLLRNIENVGYGQNFSRALSQTTGDLVFLSDQDDVWFPEKIATMVVCAEKNPEYAVYMHDAEYSDAEGKKVGVTKLQQLRRAGIPKKYFITGCCSAIRKGLIEMLLPVPNQRAHDDWLIGAASDAGKKCILKKTLILYRRHDNNATTSHTNGTEKISFVQTVKEKIFSLQKQNLLRDVQNALEHVREDVAELQKRAVCIQSEILPCVIEKKTARLHFLEQRAEAIQQGGLAGVWKKITMLLSGRYWMYASGLKSFVIDMVCGVY